MQYSDKQGRIITLRRKLQGYIAGLITNAGFDFVICDKVSSVCTALVQPRDGFNTYVKVEFDYGPIQDGGNYIISVDGKPYPLCVGGDMTRAVADATKAITTALEQRVGVLDLMARVADSVEIGPDIFNNDGLEVDAVVSDDVVSDDVPF